MYQPLHFREDRLDVQHALVRAHPLGTLVTLTSAGLIANAIPFMLDAAASERGTLKCHVARPNTVWRDADPEHEALVIFQGPASYVTPSWYATKRESGKVVPTWNYAAVHAYGPLLVRDDPAWIRDQVEALTRQQEATRTEPWAVSDAPDDFITAQMRGIVGIEIPISRIEGKWKVSQNRSAADRNGVAGGLRGDGGDQSLAMAALVVERGGS